jgi:hypothetical protein
VRWEFTRSPRRRGRAAFGGTPRPSALAVLRLITSSNLIGAWIGSSAAAHRAGYGARRTHAAPPRFETRLRCVPDQSDVLHHDGRTQDPARPPRGRPRYRTAEDEDKGVRQIAGREKAGRDEFRASEDPSRLLRELSGARDEFHLAAIVQNLKTLALRIFGPPPERPPALVASVV